MTDDFENSELFLSNEVPEQYKPFSNTELTKKQIEYARKYLNETEEMRCKSLLKLRKFLEDELDVFSELDDNYLLAFLRGSMFDFELACLLLNNTAAFFQKNRSYLNKIDTEIVRRVIECKTLGFLPYRDAKGRALALVIAENWDPDALNSEDLIFGSIVALYTNLENPVNQISGYVVILDFNNVTFRQFREIIHWIIFAIKFLKDCYPRVIREIHVIHTPTIVQWGWNIVKTFLDERAIKIITFYDSSNWENLHNKIPSCILPEEFGGQLGPFSNNHWASDICMIRKKFFDIFHDILNE